MNYTLVGYTGFVGGNLAQSHPFNKLYNSKNIAQSFGANNGFVVYCGMPAEKFLANANPKADLAKAQNAMENIRKMRPEKLVLISTVDVYPRPQAVYEDSPIGTQDALPYGQNRLALEGWVRSEYKDALILRLPGLFGAGIKKNFISDMLTLIPAALTQEKYMQLAKTQPLLRDSYKKSNDDSFYRLCSLSPAKHAALRIFFEGNSFNALSFTDSRAVYQFYALKNLWADICRCEKMGLRLVNLATQPVEAGALYRFLHGKEFENHLQGAPPRYDMRTHYGRDFGGLDDYIADRDEVVADIAKFAAQYLL